MRIKKIKIKNIRSYENLNLEFPEGSLLLSGDVGSGKTSILLAVEYALFGLQPGQTGSALLRNDSLIGEVTLELELNRKEITIERKLKKSKSVTNDYSSITIDGEKQECSTTELKTKIISLLGYPAEFIKKNNILYRYTVYTPQEQMKHIILEDSEVRLNILRHIFGIDKYKTIKENLAILLSKLKEDIKIFQIELTTLDSDKVLLLEKNIFLSELEQKIKKQSNLISEKIKKRKDIEKESLELEQKIKEKEKLETELEKTKVMYASKRDNLSTIQRELKEIESSHSESREIFNEDDLKSSLKNIDFISSKIETNQNLYIEVMGKINSLRQRKVEALEKKDRVFKIDMCPTCLQDVPIAHKHNILNETEKSIAELTKDIAKLEEKISEIFPITKKLKEDKIYLEEKKVRLQILKSHLSEFEKTNKKIIEINKVKETLEKDIALLSQQLEILKSEIFNYSKYNSLFKSKQNELKMAFVEEKNAEIYLAELKKEVEWTYNNIRDLDLAIKQKEQKKENLSGLLELNDWLSSHFSNLIGFTERNVMLKLRNEFSKLFGKWFNLLVQDAFEVRIDENFTPIIIMSGAEMDYSFLSGGERTAVALAYRLALNQIINSVMTTIKTRDIVILDEPTEGFSDTQIDKIRDVLEELSINQLIIVSHEQKIEGFVDHIIKIKKEDNSSFLVLPSK